MKGHEAYMLACALKAFTYVASLTRRSSSNVATQPCHGELGAQAAHDSLNTSNTCEHHDCYPLLDGFTYNFIYYGSSDK